MAENTSDWQSLTYRRVVQGNYFVWGKEKLSDVLERCDVFDVKINQRYYDKCVVFMKQALDLSQPHRLGEEPIREVALVIREDGTNLYLPMICEQFVLLRPHPLDDDPVTFAQRHRACSAMINERATFADTFRAIGQPPGMSGLKLLVWLEQMVEYNFLHETRIKPLT